MLLPQPLGPMMATNSPVWTARSTFRITSTDVRPEPPGKVSATCSNRRISSARPAAHRQPQLRLEQATFPIGVIARCRLGQERKSPLSIFSISGSGCMPSSSTTGSVNRLVGSTIVSLNNPGRIRVRIDSLRLHHHLIEVPHIRHHRQPVAREQGNARMRCEVLRKAEVLGHYLARVHGIVVNPTTQAYARPNYLICNYGYVLRCRNFVAV